MRLETTQPVTVKRFRRTATTFFQRTFSKSGERGASLARVLVPETHQLSLRYDEIPYHHHADWAIVAEGVAESRALLAGALTDGIDFCFVPQPRQFLLYADHDDLATLFTARKGSLSRPGAVASDHDVDEIRDFHRWGVA